MNVSALACALALATIGACAAPSPPPEPPPAPKATHGRRCDARGCVKRSDCATGACPQGKTCVKTLLCEPTGEPDCDTYCLVVLH